MTLVDVGVWLAASWDKHLHHGAAAQWIDRYDGELVLCRVTQTSLLRLLTNPAVLGDDTLRRDEAWKVIDALVGDERITWRDEPIGLDEVFRVLSARQDRSHTLWTDDYLAAFAQSASLTLATLDQRLEARYPSIRVETIGL